MLKVVEYTLLAVSLLVVIGLIVNGSSNSSDSGAQPPSLTNDGPNGSEAHEPGKTL
jgi:hypothetical protein